MKRRYVYKDARDGRFVSRLFAEANPDITVRQRVEVRTLSDAAELAEQLKGRAL